MLISLNVAKKIKYATADSSEEAYFVYSDKGKATAEDLRYAVEFDDETYELFGKHAFKNIAELKERLKEIEG